VAAAQEGGASKEGGGREKEKSKEKSKRSKDKEKDKERDRDKDKDKAGREERKRKAGKADKPDKERHASAKEGAEASRCRGEGAVQRQWLGLCARALRLATCLAGFLAGCP
jgi:hypothetical protein